MESFENFLADVGLRPSSNHSIDRIDSNGNYEPSNVKWSTAAEQSQNKRGLALSLERVAEIRRLHASGMMQKDIAKAIGLRSPSLVSMVLSGRIWKETTTPSSAKRTPAET